MCVFAMYVPNRMSDRGTGGQPIGCTELLNSRARLQFCADISAASLAEASGFTVTGIFVAP